MLVFIIKEQINETFSLTIIKNEKVKQFWKATEAKEEGKRQQNLYNSLQKAQEMSHCDRANR